MVSTKQRSAAKKNIKKAASAAKRKRTIAHLPKSVRTALGKKGSSVAKKQRESRNNEIAAATFRYPHSS
jgi:ABC-type protease/lipase transport system fused ATPase/permease subunit